MDLVRIALPDVEWQQHAELVESYFRVAEQFGVSHLQVGIVTWRSPSEPDLHWRTIKSWSEPPAPESVWAAIRAALTNRRHFRSCKECGELCNRGHMHLPDMCQSCAERIWGVVH